MTLARRVALALSFFGLSVSSVSGAEPAWNGKMLPGAAQDPSNPAPFLPYYVPAGAYSIDDASSEVTYSGFQSISDSATVGGSYHASNTAGSTATLKFFGTSIEWFGQMTASAGIASVYLDGALQSAVDTYNPTASKQQRLFAASSLSAKHAHTLVIKVTGKHGARSTGSQVSIDAFVITRVPFNSNAVARRDQAPITSSSGWNLLQAGTTGVAAMQLAIVTDRHAIILDKVEHNPLNVNGHPAWGALYDLQDNSVRALNVQSNSFCAGGTWLSNGTLLSIGGNPVVESTTSSADFGDLNGLQALRMFNPCDDGKCDIVESPNRLRMASPRWYNSATRLDDGSVMIIGGSKKGGWINNVTVNNPTVEYFPPKNLHGKNGLPIDLDFLSYTLNANLFPIAFTLPDGRVFMAANRDAIIYDWRANTEQRLPQIPNGVRVTYPMSGTALLLPLMPENGNTPEIMICGGSTIDDKRPGYKISSQEAASSQCSRMVLSSDGIKAGWSVEDMPDARVMPDAVLLPDGKVLIVNGGKSGIAGYGNVLGQVGQSNADNPVFTPVLYDPSAPAGKRFDSSLPTSDIPRLYHSVATLTPNGSVMIAGSNPNLDRSNEKYQTEYRVEWLLPPYMTQARPTVTASDLPSTIAFGKQFTVGVGPVAANAKVSVSLMDLGFVTHGVHMNSRLVVLSSSLSADGKSLTITAPSSGMIYPPGPGWLYVLVDGVPSTGKKVMVGDGAGPPVDEGAIQNMLAHTENDSSPKDTKGASG